jgi:hypothetical protein
MVAMLTLVLGSLLSTGAYAGLATLGTAIVAADFNHDGALDIALAVTTITGPLPHPGFVSVILQDPAAPGTFLEGVHYDTISEPCALAVGDLNGDNLPDLIVASSSFGNISILLQDASHPGTFLPQTKVWIGAAQGGIAIGDLNGDGLPDIAIGANTRNLRILYQDPDGSPGTFLPPVNLALDGVPSAVAIADIDGDGFNDLAIALSSKNQVAVLLQDPSAPGSFSERDYNVGAQPGKVAIGDLDG